MWHETEDEMMEMLKSIFRVDQDYSSRRILRKHFKVKDPYYYEWETHIFFDNCFKFDKDEKEWKVLRITQAFSINYAISTFFYKRSHRRPIPTFKEILLMDLEMSALFCCCLVGRK